MFELRPYQLELKRETYGLWNQGVRNVLAVMPTGAGKTVYVSDIFHDHKGAAVAIAHRQELVGQISLALGRQEVFHNIIAPQKIIKFISNYHMEELGRSFFHPQAPVTTAGVDTLIRRHGLGQWTQQVSLCFIDEAHHVLVKNKWGVATQMFPNALQLGTTATPERADGNGLGRQASGIYDAMVLGPDMRALIEMGNLTDYRIFAPPSDLNLENVAVSNATGEFNQHQLRQESKKSHIVGDIVQHYLRLTPGKRGVTFTVDVDTASEVSANYRNHGIPAAVVSAKTSDHVRTELIRGLRNGTLQQLVNVDLIGEGFDLPAIEVVSMGRPTQSYSLYCQQFGRALRPIPGKTHAFIIDHVGNVVRHGLPDANRKWSLDDRSRKASQNREDVIEASVCQACMSVFERYLKACPHCGFVKEPEGRARPEQVDGDLCELTPEALRQLRGEIAKIRETPEALVRRMTHAGAPDVAIHSAYNHRQRNFAEHHQALDDLIHSINTWGSLVESKGVTRNESYKLFYLKFGIDVLSAQALSKKEALELNQRIQENYDEHS